MRPRGHQLPADAEGDRAPSHQVQVSAHIYAEAEAGQIRAADATAIGERHRRRKIRKSAAEIDDERPDPRGGRRLGNRRRTDGEREREDYREPWHVRASIVPTISGTV